MAKFFKQAADLIGAEKRDEELLRKDRERDAAKQAAESHRRHITTVEAIVMQLEDAAQVLYRTTGNITEAAIVSIAISLRRGNGLGAIGANKSSNVSETTKSVYDPDF